MNELKNAAVINCAKSNGIPVKRIKIDVKKWNPGGVARGSPPMWYGFQRGSFPSSRIRFMMLPCNPMSELGGYSLWKITAALKRNAKLNMTKSSRVLLCLVVNHHRNRYDYPFSWTKFIVCPELFLGKEDNNNNGKKKRIFWRLVISEKPIEKKKDVGRW